MDGTPLQRLSRFLELPSVASPEPGGGCGTKTEDTDSFDGANLAALDTGGNILTICMLGPTGAGKSSTCNSLFAVRNDLFPIGMDMSSTTSHTIAQVYPWRGLSDRIRCVDTPGFMDSRGASTDVRQIEDMVNFLKHRVRHVHVFLLFFKRDDNKMSQPLKDMLRALRNIFGDSFVANVMIAFTHWEYTKRGERMEQTKANLMNEEVRKVFNHDFQLPCVYIDNLINCLSEEELRDLLEDDLEASQRRFETELQKIMTVMRSQDPFFCDGVAAVVDMERTTQRLRDIARQGQFYDQGRLGRCLRNCPADTDIIHQGWLRWRHQKMWAVLKRHALQIFRTESCEKLIKSLELNGCICFPVQPSIADILLSSSRFAISKPIDDEFGSRYHEEMSSNSDDERRRWMVLVLEASQISKSWHRIHSVHEKLRAAEDMREYITAIAHLENKTVVIPIVWLNTLIGQRRESSDKQLFNDVKRDTIIVNGRKFAYEEGAVNVDGLTAEVAYHILRHIQNEFADQEEPPACSEARAMILARDAVLCCSRTFGQVHSSCAVVQLFGSPNLVGVAPKIGPDDTVKVNVVSAASLRDALDSFNGSLCVPQFEGETSSPILSMKAVQNMLLEGEQRLEGAMLSQDQWVQDWELNQCMWCGVSFLPWLRRHHCRACGALVCFNCSQHSLCFGSSDIARVCWLCYKKAAMLELNTRKFSSDADNLGTEGDSMSDCHEETCGENNLDGVAADEVEFPLLTIEMIFRYRIHDLNPARENYVDLFTLECKYMRVVRWSGLADEGRVIISLTAA
eukprot:TRINITY_DN3335_c0_g2_i1.p1 TRINITY_DN3335_c0_g2~~TRINITY_DN3335_c0_g2_i1.p1  ORF type:complete len:816 (+),score=139.93 TRINITY_DN3335_c0_g2_i1:66-2450(+)